MTSKERILKALKKEEYDRIPVWMLINKVRKSKSHVDPHKHPSYRALIKPLMNKTDSLERINLYDSIFYSDPVAINVKKEKKYSEGGNIFKKIEIESKNGILKYAWMIKKGYSFQEKIEYAVKEIDDIDKILALPYKLHQIDLSEFFKFQQTLNDSGAATVNLWSPVYSVCDLIPAVKFYLWLKTDFNKIIDLIEFFYERLSSHLKYLLENGVGPCFWIGGSEYMGPPLTSVDLWKELVFKYDKKIIELIHQYGGLVIYHHHGWIDDILDLILEMSPDGLHPVEEPPVGNILLREAKKRAGDRICLIGNIQYDDIFNCSTTEIELKVKKAIHDAGKKNFILSLTAGPYIYPLAKKALQNYIHFINCGFIYGKI